MAQKVLGVDVTSHTIKLALVSNEKRPKLIAGEIVAMPSGAWANDTLLDGKAVVHAIQGAMLTSRALSRAEAVSVCVNTSQTVVRPIKLPVLSEKEIRPAIEFELARSFPGIAKTHAISFREYSRSRENILGVVSFSPLRTLDAYKEIVEGLNYKSAYLDVASNCDAKAYHKFCMADKENKAVMLLSVGLLGSRFTVVENGLIRHSRYVGEGDAMLVDLLCETLNLTQEAFLLNPNAKGEGSLSKALSERSAYQKYMGALAEQARQTLEFYASGAQNGALPVTEVLLSGECALYPGFREYLSSVTGVEVRAAKSVLPVEVAPDAFARLFTALGAAVREG